MLEHEHMNDTASPAEPSIEPTLTAPRRKGGPQPGPRRSASPPLPSPVLDERNAARFIDYSRWALRKWRRTSAGPQYLKIGRTVKYRISDLELWLNSHIRQSA